MNAYLLKKGGNIRFYINNYSSALNLPATAPDNSYAIISDRDVTNFYISIAEPENPIADSVWVKNSIFQNEDSVNVIYNGSLIVTPFEFLQRVGNEWIHREAYLFKNGKWVPYKKFLIKDGKFTSFLTGFTFWKNDGKTEYVYDEAGGYLLISLYSSQYASQAYYLTTQNTYDFKNISRIGIEYSGTDSLLNAEITLRQKIGYEESAITEFEKTAEKIKKTSFLNMSYVTGEGYDITKYNRIGLTFVSEKRKPLRIYNLWLE